MPVNLSVKNVPDDVARGLHNRAATHGRTLNAELLDILRQAARGQEDVSIDTLLERSQAPRPALDETTSRVLADKDAEQERTAQQFEDLLGKEED